MTMPLYRRLVGPFSLLLFIAWLAALGVAPAFAQNRWIKISAPEFTLYSSGDEAESLEMAEQFHHFFNHLIQDIIRTDLKTLTPLTIVTFGREKEFKSFRPNRPDGTVQNVAGFFVRSENWSMFTLSMADSDERVRAILYHEGVHWVMSGRERFYPAWLEEGMAEVFSTFRTKRDQVSWGIPIESHITWLQENDPLPLERLLNIDRNNPLFNEDRRTGQFYASAWAFTHYLLYGRHGLGPQVLNDFIEASRQTADNEVLVKQVLKKDIAAVNNDLYKYMRKNSYRYENFPRVETTAKLVAAPATPGEVALALARVALAGRQEARARTYLKEALTLAPESPEAHALLGTLDLNQDRAAAEASFRTASDLKSRDYFVYATLARILHRGGASPDNSVQLSHEQANEVANNYKIALNLRPYHLLSYQGLAAIQALLPAEEANIQADTAFLKRGHRFYPADGMIQIGLAILARKEKQPAEMEKWLNQVLNTEQPKNVKRYAERLRNRWNFEPAYEEIIALQSSEKFAEAMTKLTALREQPTDYYQRQALKTLKLELETELALLPAKTELQKGDMTTARQLLEALIEGEEVPEKIKNRARGLLRQMR